jgi:hypothetical protein
VGGVFEGEQHMHQQFLRQLLHVHVVVAVLHVHVVGDKVLHTANILKSAMKFNFSMSYTPWNTLCVV